MKKCIKRMSIKGDYYFVSWNPNNGDYEFTKDITKSTTFGSESDWRMESAAEFIKNLEYTFPFSIISLIDVNQ